MTCDEFLRVVDAYLDDELSLSDILHLRGHLISCERCHQVLRAEITLHALITDDATRDRPPESLRERILRRVIAADCTSARHGPKSSKAKSVFVADRQ